MKLENSARRAITTLRNIHFWRHVVLLHRNTLFPPNDPVRNRKNTFEGKTIAMIGATSAIVAEAALKIARLNAFKLIIGVPDVKKGIVLKQRIENEAHRDEDFCKVLELDIMNFQSIETFFRELCRETCDLGLHAVLLNTNLDTDDLNDKTVRTSETMTTSGTMRAAGTSRGEEQLQLNVLSTAYLAIFVFMLLLNTSIREKRDTHLEFVGTQLYQWQNFRSLLNDAISFGSTKLLKTDILYVDQLQHWGLLFLKNVPAQGETIAGSSGLHLVRRSNLPRVVMFSAEPGPCEFPVSRAQDAQLSSRKKLYKRLFVQTFEQGSRTLVNGLLKPPKVHRLRWKQKKANRDDWIWE